MSQSQNSFEDDRCSEYVRLML